MKKLFILLTLIGALYVSGCQEGLSGPTQPDKEQEQDKEDNKDDGKDDGKEETPQQIVVNGTTLADSTTLYGVVTNTQTGKGIKGIVVSDGFNCVTTDDNGNLSIYYNNELVVCHEVSSKMYNYTVDTACDILKSDAMRSKTDAEILAFVKNNLLNMDRCIGGL